MATRHNSAMGRSRDFGLNGAGKGDSPRNNQSPEFRANYDEIDWTTRPHGPMVRPVKTVYKGPKTLRSMLARLEGRR